MTRIIYESEIFAQNVKGVWPYQIIIEEEKEGGITSISVKRVEYTPDMKLIEKNTHYLTTSMWRDSSN